MAILNASWSGRGSFLPPKYKVHANFDQQALHVSPLGEDASQHGSTVAVPELLAWPQGIDAFATGNTFVGKPASGHVRPSQYQIYASWHGADRYEPPIGAINPFFNFNLTPLSPPSLDAQAFGQAVMIWSQPIYGEGFDSQSVAEIGYTLSDWQYPTPRWVVDATWKDEPYNPASGFLPVSFNPFRLSVLTTGYDAQAFGEPLVGGTQYVDHLGFESSIVASDNIYALHWWEYAAPIFRVDASWSGAKPYAAPQGFANPRWFPTKDQDSISVIGFHHGVVSQPTIERWLEYVTPSGIHAPQVDGPFVGNNARPIQPSGFVATAFGPSVTELWRRYLLPEGFDASLYGDEAFLSGGVKHVTVNGRDFSGYGKVVVINTTADSGIRGRGFLSFEAGRPDVSPRTLFATGLYAYSTGTPLVQFPPQPAGFHAGGYGTPVIEYRTKWIATKGIYDAELFGYPRVFDPTRFVYPGAVLGTGVFGDIRVANQSVFLNPIGFTSFEGSDWAELRSNRRFVDATGIGAFGAGDTGIRNKTPSVVPGGIDAMQPGTALVAYRLRYIYGRGFDLLATGKPTAVRTPSIEPKGIQGAIGDPTVWYRNRNLDALGVTTDEHGSASVWFRYRYIKPLSYEPDRYGSQKVEHGRKELIAKGAAHARHGTGRVSNANRMLEPESIHTEFASAHMVGGSRFLNPVGYDAARFGVRVIPERQSVYPLGFGAIYGQAVVYNSLQRVRPVSVNWTQPADRWGKGRIWNLRQYVTLYFDPDSQLNPPAWPQWTAIENRTKALLMSGHDSLRYGNQQIDNAARPILPAGIDSAFVGDQSMVAMRYRPLALEGMEAPYISNWARIYNAAVVVRPEGVDAQQSGVAAVVNTRRYYRAGGFEISRLGYPMVADRIRELSIEKRYSIDAPRIDLPEVKLYTRYVDGIGYEPMRIGLPSLSIHWTIIETRWTLQNFYGYPRVYNVTPELGARGHSSELFGDAVVRLQWRPVAPDGGTPNVFGRTAIADRDRSITPLTIPAGPVSDKLKVIKTGAPPYSLQYIWLYIPKDDSEEEGSDKTGESYGIPIPEDQVSEEILINGQYAHHISEEESLVFGKAEVVSNMVRIEQGYHNHLSVAEPYVGLRVRYIYPASEPKNGIPEDKVLGVMPQEIVKPRLSPHTIYATMESNDQARRNHPIPGNIPMHVIDGRRYPRNNGDIAWGNARVNFYHRTVSPRGIRHEIEAVASIYNATIYVLPDGRNYGAVGMPDIPGDKIVRQFQPSTEVWGRPEIKRGPYRGPIEPKPIEIPKPVKGEQAWISLHNRSIHPVGTLMEKMGTRKVNDKPYLWQGLRVGPLMPTIPEGTDQAAIGEAWVSMRVREILFEGFDTFASEYDLENFKDRMRVRHAFIPAPASQGISDVSIESATVVGMPDIKRSVHYIKPDGNANQYRKGVF